MVSLHLISFGFIVYLLVFTAAPGPTRKKKKVSHVEDTSLSYKSRTLNQWLAIPRESLTLICNAERINTRGTAPVLARRLFDHFRNFQLTHSSAVLQPPTPLTSSSSIVSPAVISNSSSSTTVNLSPNVPLTKETTTVQNKTTTVQNSNIDNAMLSTSIRELIRQAVQEALVSNNLVPPSVTNVNFAPSVPPFTTQNPIPNHHGGLELPSSAVPIQPNLFSNLVQNLTNNETVNPHQYTAANNF